jgi:hypothetical protein
MCFLEENLPLFMCLSSETFKRMCKNWSLGAENNVEEFGFYNGCILKTCGSVRRH